MRHRIRAHRAAENQQDGGQNRGLYHRQRNAEHGLPLGRVEDGCGLFKIGIHVPENTADQDIGERRVVQAQDHQAWKQALAPPYRHVDAEQGGKQTVGRAGDGVGVKQVLPHDGQRPLRHDVRENKNGTQIFSPRKVGSRDQKREQPAVENGHHAGADSEKHRIEKRCPQICLGHAAGEKVCVVDGRVAGRLPSQMGIDGSGVNFKGILHDSDDRRDRGEGQNNAKQQQNDVVRLGKEGLDLVEHNRRSACAEGSGSAHGFLLFSQI